MSVLEFNCVSVKLERVRFSLNVAFSFHLSGVQTISLKKLEISLLFWKKKKIMTNRQVQTRSCMEDSCVRHLCAREKLKGI